MEDTVRIAAVQMDPAITEKAHNLSSIVLKTRTAAGSGARLIVFPECALTGYVFASRAEALQHAETIPGPSTDALSAVARELRVYVVAGMLETDAGKCFNSAVLIGPEGLIGRYRKTHLPFSGVDRFIDPGNEPFRVYETSAGRIGILICYDCNFPETARILTLLGADVVALPTNWPAGRGKTAKHVVVSRAFENRVHLVAADRVGTERGVKFIGLSKIINSWGDILAEAGGEDERTIYGEVSLSEAREKRIVYKASETEFDFICDRRPELYGMISESRSTESTDPGMRANECRIGHVPPAHP